MSPRVMASQAELLHHALFGTFEQIPVFALFAVRFQVIAATMMAIRLILKKAWRKLRPGQRCTESQGYLLEALFAE